MSFKVEVIADHTGKWIGHPTRFLTRLEAEGFAAILAMHWNASRYRVIESREPVSYPLTLEDCDEGDD